MQAKFTLSRTIILQWLAQALEGWLKKPDWVELGSFEACQWLSGRKDGACGRGQLWLDSNVISA
jgi:hypothetical protein